MQQDPAVGRITVASFLKVGRTLGISTGEAHSLLTAVGDSSTAAVSGTEFMGMMRCHTAAQPVAMSVSSDEGGGEEDVVWAVANHHDIDAPSSQTAASKNTGRKRWQQVALRLACMQGRDAPVNGCGLPTKANFWCDFLFGCRVHTSAALRAAAAAASRRKATLQRQQEDGVVNLYQSCKIILELLISSRMRVCA